MEQFSYINEEFYASQVTPEQTDLLLAGGWRHFGEHFYRYNLGYYKYDIRSVYALRVNLAKFSFSKNQRRVLKKNQDFVQGRYSKRLFRPRPLKGSYSTFQLFSHSFF
jgi:arginine-tRNA-protein transferase